jgi:hypothetical protein
MARSYSEDELIALLGEPSRRGIMPSGPAEFKTAADTAMERKRGQSLFMAWDCAGDRHCGAVSPGEVNGVRRWAVLTTCDMHSGTVERFALEPPE